MNARFVSFQPHIQAVRRTESLRYITRQRQAASVFIPVLHNNISLASLETGKFLKQKKRNMAPASHGK